MGFVRVLPAGLRSAGAAAIRVRVGRRARGGGVLVLIVSFSANLIPDAPTWLVRGRRVDVLIGDGTEAGSILIQDDGPWLLATTRTSGPAVAFLTLPLPEWIARLESGYVEAAYTCVDGGILVSVPRQLRAS